MKITYQGPFPEIEVRVGQQFVTISHGETADLPDALASELARNNPDAWKTTQKETE